MCKNFQIYIPMQTSMKNDDLSDSFQCKPEMVFFKSDFLNQNDVFRGISCTRKNMSIKRLYY